ncbi:HD domain-containing protein [Metabacillus idriensis]|uniref:HD domain-containing protein n=1 Tax=Metabacillus idriensis TaxID=324768 RepID=UPI00174C808D|nr:HD domain-containing protein [Metabacillus idriensis]
MIINDSVYGEFKVEGILEELIHSKPVQRLKGIHQGGASYLVNEKWDVTRFEHSIGVMILIKKLGGSLEEQIAGLLHDISHTAFSHVIDFVLENKEEDYHEKIYKHVVEDSDIPWILHNSGYDYKEILFDDSKWTLLEQPAPELCADRVDYTLRDMHQYGYISNKEVQFFLENVFTKDGKMVLLSIEAAEWFTEIYYKEVIDFFMDPLNIYGYDSLAKILKCALNKQIIKLDDLLGTDQEVMEILNSSHDYEIKQLVNQLHPRKIVKEDQNDYDLHRKTKIRLIDPSVLHNDKLVKASLLSDKVKLMNEKASKKAAEGMFVKVISP